MSVLVRAAVESHAPDIARIHVRTWQSAYAGIVNADYLAALSIPERTKTWAAGLSQGRMPDGGRIFVAEIEGEVAGWMTCGASRDDGADADTGELHGIYVDADVQGRGVGAALMQVCCDELRHSGFTRATLLVFSRNISARNWYEQHGWTFDGTEAVFTIGNQEVSEVRYARDL